jgi:hypothetical protein
VLERSVRRSNQGPAIARDRQFQTGVRDTLDQVAPDGATAQPLINRAQQEIDARLGAAQENVDRAETYGNRTEQVRAAHGQDVEGYRGQKPAASEALDRQVVGASLDPMDQMRRRRYNAVPNEPVPGQPLYEAAQGVRAAAEDLPPDARQTVLPADRVRDFERLGAPIRDEDGNIIGHEETDFRTINRMRPILSQDKAKARLENAPPERIDNLRALQETINDITNNFPPAAEANRFFNEDYAPVWGREAGEAYSLRQDVNKDRLNRTGAPRSETAGRFLVAGSPEKTAALERIFTTIPDPTQAQAAARQFLMADLAEKNVVDARTGALRPNALRNWRLKNDNTLGTVPGLQQEVDDLLEQANKGERVAGRFAEELQNARREQNITQDQINRSSLRAVTDVDPESAVAAIMGDPNSSGRRLRELIDLTAGDDAARTGLKAAVRDYLVDKATNSNSEALVAGDRRGPVSSAKLTQIFNKHEAELAQVFSPEEMNTLRAGHRALELQNVNRVRVETGSATQSNKVVDQILQSPLGKGVEAALRVKYGLLKTGGLISTARRLTAGIGKQEADDAMRLVERAAFDPDLMARLLGREIPIGSPRWNARLNTILGVAEGAREEYGTDGQGSKGPLKITVNPAKR